MAIQPPSDPVFEPFQVAILDRRYESQIPIARIHLRHILFEDTAQEFLTLLQEQLISPLLLQQTIPFYEIAERIQNFFAEGATLSLDSQLNYYTPDELSQIMSGFDPALHFTFRCPHHPQPHHAIVYDLSSQRRFFEELRHVQLL